MTLDEYKKCFNLTFDQFITLNKIGSGQINENVSYEKLANMTGIDLGQNQYFFFKGNQLEMIYISDNELTTRLWNEFKSTTNVDVPDETVRSRAGKTSNQNIFPTQGIASSIARDRIDFIEIFRPCTLADYLSTIYFEPQRFIR